MSGIDKLKGKLLDFVGRVIDWIFKLLIGIVEFVVSLAKGAFGLLGLLLFLGPFAFILLLFLGPSIFGLIILVALTSFLGNKGIIYLKYLRYMITEYIFDRADKLMYGRKIRYETFMEYGNRYWQMEAERKQKEARQRQEEAEKRFKEAFFGQWEDFQGQQSQWGGQYGGGYQSGYSGVGQTTNFKQQYEESCDLLGVAYNSSKEDIRSAYRRKAKEYHPDINKDENATEMFQKVNDANTFLSDSNIEKYKKIS